MDEFEKTPPTLKSTKKPVTASRATPGSSRASQFTYDPSAASGSTQQTPTRPPVRPLGNNKSVGKRSNGGLNVSAGGSGGFITQAERSRLEAKEKKRAEEDCFEFLQDLRDVCLLLPSSPILMLMPALTDADDLILLMSVEREESPRRTGL